MSEPTEIMSDSGSSVKYCLLPAGQSARRGGPIGGRVYQFTVVVTVALAVPGPAPPVDVRVDVKRRL